MSNYIDGFVFTLPRAHLEDYRKLAESVSILWKEHGALDYREYIAEDLVHDGTRSFIDLLSVEEGDAIIFGWVEFESRTTRDLANQRIASDPRIPSNDIFLRSGFNASKMAYAGFRAFLGGTVIE